MADSTPIALAHALRLRITAEGIETPEQARTLRDLGADQAQGYHCSRPVPAALALEFLRRPAPQE
jgi:EAL domain-containing protein (putative c-di-GMP-specific phosphodiesterase class I)